MKIFYKLITLILFISIFGCSNTSEDENLTPRENPLAMNASYINGQWLTVNGEFSDQTLYSVNGIFRAEEPARIDTVIDLQGAYVIPPFGDAHNHAFGDRYSVGFSDDVFLARGFFYGMNLTNPYSSAAALIDTLSRPETIDVAFSHGGISAPKGSRPHPATVMKRVYSYLTSDTTSQWTLEGDAYWFMTSKEQIEEKWPQLMNQNPDVIKVYIMRYGEDNPDLPECGYGLCPEELKIITDSARANNKRVFAHVNTARDFQLALDVGVDGIAHLPLGNDGVTIEDAGPLTLADSTIQQAGEMGIILTPTAHLLTRDLDSFRTDTLTAVIGLQREQLRRLKESGVTLALGADGYSDNPLREVMHLSAYDVFDNSELLRILSIDTPKVIFPDRKFAALKAGYEASFVSLECNPIEDFSCVERVDTLVKQGEPLK